MSKLPNESDFPRYDSTEYWPLCAKFLFYGADKGAAPREGIRSFQISDGILVFEGTCGNAK